MYEIQLLIDVILLRQMGESRTQCIALENLSQTPNFRVSHLHLSSNKTTLGSKSVEDFAVTQGMVRHGEDGIEKKFCIITSHLDRKSVSAPL